jgi:hypothetical protein
MIATAMMFAVALNANASQVSPVPTENRFGRVRAWRVRRWFRLASRRRHPDEGRIRGLDRPVPLEQDGERRLRSRLASLE